MATAPWPCTAPSASRLENSDPIRPELLHEAQLVDRQIVTHLGRSSSTTHGENDGPGMGDIYLGTSR